MKKEFKNFDELCNIFYARCSGNCEYCPIQYGIDNNFKIEGVFDNIQTIEVRKIYFLGKDDKMYYWYCKKETQKVPIPPYLDNVITKFKNRDFEYIRTDWFEIEKDKIELLTLSIIKYDKSFAKVYINEKNKLLDLCENDEEILKRIEFIPIKILLIR